MSPLGVNLRAPDEACRVDHRDVDGRANSAEGASINRIFEEFGHTASPE
jgi:hypothetical protein